MPLLPSFRKSTHDGDGSKECLKKSTSAQNDLRSLLTVPHVDITLATADGSSCGQFVGESSQTMRVSYSEVTLSLHRSPSDMTSSGQQRYGSRLHVPSATPNYLEVPTCSSGGGSLKKTSSKAWLPTFALTKCRLSRVGSESRSMLGIPFPRTPSRCSMSPSICSSHSVMSLRTNCKLCLCDLPQSNMLELKTCNCVFCRECMELYIKIQILDGNVRIPCPDGQCLTKSFLTDEEIESLADEDLFTKYQLFKRNTEIDLDTNRTWCPSPGCETICELDTSKGNTKWEPLAFTCNTCQKTYCSACKATWQNDHTCKGYVKKKSAWFLGSHDRIYSVGDGSSIKHCPCCHVPIERDNGCAQMMCKRCKHVFCWYCLASLDDDFLLRHYDKGPCKNKLGHSRASIIWHRTQVVGIFAGFGILLLVASPLLLLAAPCILCCKCKVCDHCGDADGDTAVANL